MAGTKKDPTKEYSENWGGSRGGGRKKLSESGRQRYTLSLQQFEIDLIKQKAKEKDLKISRYIMSLVNNDK